MDFNAQASEYSTVRSKLQTAHENQMRNLNQAYETLKGFTGNNNSFNVEMTSAKLNKLVDAIGSDILPTLAAVFSQSEKNLDSFIDKIKSVDKE